MTLTPIFKIRSSKFDILFSVSLIILIVVYAMGMNLTLMDIDASKYALISKQMLQTHHFLQVYCNGADYLDKPPLVFWTACLSFLIFGIHDWAYRLPSVLCLILGIYSTYKLAKIYYPERTAKMAALIMASCIATYLMTSDVRIDTMLTGWVMFSLWQLAEFNRSLKLKYILSGAMGIGFALLTKGPIGLIIPVTAFSAEFIYKRQWKNFFRWQYLLAILLIALILLPMSYGLYKQFDLHPEKILYDRKGTSGLRFFYWTQSFGRITGESSWNNNPDPFFLVHSFLWSFAPWCILFVPALCIEIKNVIQQYKKNEALEIITVGGFILIFIFLTRSRYQLPHYTFAIHPLAAIILAKYLGSQWPAVSSQSPDGVNKKSSVLFNVFYGIHVFLMFVIYIIMFIIVLKIFPAPLIYLVLTGVSFCFFLFFIFNKTKQTDHNYLFKIFIITLIPFVTLIFILNTRFYPPLLKYQSGSIVAKYLDETAPGNAKILLYKDYNTSFAMDFYSKYPVTEFVNEQNLGQNLTQGKTFIFADSVYVKNIQSINPEIKVVQILDEHSPTLLSWKFLNPSTRNSNVEKKALLKY